MTVHQYHKNGMMKKGSKTSKGKKMPMKGMGKKTGKKSSGSKKKGY